MDDAYEVYAIRYARRDARRHQNFMGGDLHDAPMPMDYFVWVVRNPARVVVVDTGFTQAMSEKREHEYLRSPAAGMALIGVDAATVKDVVITHLHYDHVGTFHEFPAARFHVQDDEIAYATGRYMRYRQFNRGYEPEDVAGMVKLVFKDRVQFHDGTGEIAPGVTVHRIGGHTRGMQCVRVMTRRGWVVLASDASHYYEHFETGRCFPTSFHVGEMVEGYAKLRALAASPAHVIPGHDPLVMDRYPPPSRELAGIVVRLDVPPA